MTRPTTTGKAQDLITFTRSTTGTALAKISYGEELVTNGDFSAGTTGWSSYRGAALSASGGSFVVSADTGSYGGSGSQGITTVAGKTYTLSFQFISATGSNSYVAVRTNPNVGVGTTIAFVTTSGLSAGMHSATFTATGTTTYITVVAQNPNDVTTVDNISVKEVSFDQPDGTLQLFNHPINKPRIEYDAEGNCLGLLVEEGRTNLMRQSEDLTTWNKSNATVTANQIAAPDGTNTGYKVNENAATTPHFIYQTGFTFTSGEEYTQSVYAKAGTNNIVQLLGTSAAFGSQAWANFDLSDGTIGSKGTATAAAIQSVGEGWYRCSITITVTITSGGSAGFIILVPTKTSSRAYVYEGNPSNHIYAWGSQLELGAFPTSYIPTSGSAVTRSADVASLAVSKFGYNQGQGTVVVEAVMPPSVISEQFWILGSNTNSARWFYSNSGDSSLNAYDGAGTSQVSPLQPSATQKMAIGTDQSTTILCLDGVSGNQASTNGNISSLTTVFYFGGNWSTPVLNLNGHIKSVQYYPLRLSNAQLQALTS